MADSCHVPVALCQGFRVSVQNGFPILQSGESSHELDNVIFFRPVDLGGSYRDHEILPFFDVVDEGSGLGHVLVPLRDLEYMISWKVPFFDGGTEVRPREVICILEQSVLPSLY